MDVSMMGAAADALLILMDPFRLLMLASGVLMGLFLGIVPGIGGLAGMALLLPFTYAMDSYAAFAMLLGMSAVTGTSDTIPAVLFGVPGSAGAQATVMDGNPMAKNGEAGRALSAAYVSSLIGGIFGAVLLAISIPLLRPMMLYIGTPELLALSFFGIAMVATLSGGAPLRGLVAAAIGIMLSMVGPDTQTGTLRWTLGFPYLWEGVPLVPVVLGLFALPEIADLAIKRMAIASDAKTDVWTGMSTGIKDALKNWWLIVRCGGIGAGIGAIPGLGSSVVDWIAYGHALQTVKGAEKTFGKGDVRGVIAPEAANNAITAGSLIPTVAFGVPGSASMAILLGVFLIHGLVPGPDMLTIHLNITYSMIWSVALANILGAGICFSLSGQLAKIALLRHTVILPPVMTFIFVGSFQASREWGDLVVLLIFTVIGWTMKQLRWPRPPLILGFVLGALIERYMFISFTRFGTEWLERPLVLGILALSFFVLLGPTRRHWRYLGGIRGIAANCSAPRFRFPDLMHVVVIAASGYMVASALAWPWAARIGPVSIGIGILLVCGISLLNQVFTHSVADEERANGGTKASQLHFDTESNYVGMAPSLILARAGAFAAYCLLFMGLIEAVGFLPAIAILVTVYMRLDGREKWALVLGMSTVLTFATYFIFDQLLHLPWPPSLLGHLLPALKVIPSV